MKERPILFSAPMVRAVLSGTKTQTRRVVNPQPFDDPNGHGVQWHGGPALVRAGYGDRYVHSSAESVHAAMLKVCPYGKPGDRLWVRETCLAREQFDGLDGVLYLADMVFRPIENTEAAADAWVKLNHYGGRGHGHTVPAIHMPRWASRITLEITDVRVERLQDISEADAEAEGGDCLTWSGEPGLADLIDWPLKTVARPWANGYALLWESINGLGSWKANPWVWVIEFRRLP